MCDDNTRYTISNTKCNKYTILVPSTPTKTISNQTKHQLHQPKYQVRQPKYQVRQPKGQVHQAKQPSTSMWLCVPKYKFTQFCCKFMHFFHTFSGLKMRWRTKNEKYEVWLLVWVSEWVDIWQNFIWKRILVPCCYVYICTTAIHKLCNAQCAYILYICKWVQS